MVAIVVGRDVLLVVGAFAARAKSLGWRWPGFSEFFRVAPGGPGVPQPGAAAGQAAGQAAGAAGARSSPAPAAPLVQPLFVSKVNTVFQLGMVGTCILQSWQGWPGEGAVLAGSALTAGTTLWSCWAYLQAYRQGRVLAPSVAPPQTQT